MLPVVIVRPEPGAGATLEAARALGLEAHAHPLFAVRPLGWEPPPPDGFDALLLGSANALRHAGPALARYRDLPVHAVGEATAQAARAAGFAIAATGTGGLQAVLGAVPPGTRLLRLAGRERVALVPPPSVTVIERTVYASEPLPLDEALARRLAGPCVVLLHSAAAASHLAHLCERAGIGRANLRLAAIGPRVAQAAGTGWAAIATAAVPDDGALLALARDLCQ